MRKSLLCGLACLLPLLAGCPKDDAPVDPNAPPTPAGGGALSGTLYWDSGSGAKIHKLDLATGADQTLGLGASVFKAADGPVIFVSIDLVESNEDLVQHRVIVKYNTDVEASNDGFQNPQISPEGTMVAYETSNHNCYVANRADGKIIARFEPNGGRDGCERPTWTPDGRIVVAGGFANQGLYISDGALTTLKRFDPGVSRPQFPSASPDGKNVAFVTNDLVFVIGIDGTGLTKLDDDTTQDAHDIFPVWSPDGSQIAYVASAGRLKIRPAAGGKAIDVLETYPALAEQVHGFGTSYQIQWVK